jgi:ActR/RegA family two-component response regulator
MVPAVLAQRQPMRQPTEGVEAVGSGENVLIVEDEEEWRGIYERAVQEQGSGPTVKMASDRASAERLIEAAKFAVAFVDVSLDPDDAQNTDGLQVMKKIRATGDETSIVVVTGRSGQDVLKITRDAIKEYDAFDTLGKSAIEPTKITELLEDGLKAYRQASATGRQAAAAALRGPAEAMRWDDRVMRATHFNGDAGKFYDFLNALFGAYLPLVPRRGAAEVSVDSSTGLVHGDYWSRAIAAPIVILFGPAEQFEQAVAAGQVDGGLLGKYQVGDPVEKRASHAVMGAVFPLVGGGREEFGGHVE